VFEWVVFIGYKLESLSVRFQVIQKKRLGCICGRVKSSIPSGGEFSFHADIDNHFSPTGDACGRGSVLCNSPLVRTEKLSMVNGL